MGNLGAPEIVIIVLVIVLLFGAKKLPDLARSVGRSMRIFKSEVKEMSNDDGQPIQDFQQPVQQQLPQGQQYQQPQQGYQQQPQQSYQQPQQQGYQQGYEGGNYSS